MDWTNLTFVGGTVIAMIVKKMFLEKNPALRDKMVPIVAFIGNLLIRVSTELASGEGPIGIAPTAALESAVVYAAFWDSTAFKMFAIPFVDTLGSWGLHRLKKYRDAWVMSTPTRKR